MTDRDQPDLRPVITDAINQLMRTQTFQADQPQEPVTLNQVEILSQRTLQYVQTLNSKLNGGHLAASLALVTQEAGAYPWLFVTCRPVGEINWQPVGSVSGTGSEDGAHPFLGKSTAPRSFLGIGSLNVIPDGGRISIEMPDGTVYEERVENGCCVVLAPITHVPESGKQIEISYRNPDGSEIRSERV